LEYIADLLTTILILGSAAGVVAFLAGEAGILHVCSASLMGLGAYMTAIASVRMGLTVWVALALTIPVGLFAGACLHCLTRRLSSSFMAMGLLAAGLVLHGAMLSWVNLTGGPMGIANIPAMPQALNVPWIGIIVAAAVAVLVLWVPRTLFGSRIRALRDDEQLSEELNLRPGAVRFQLFLGSSVTLTLLGGIYAYHLRFVDPSSFVLRESMTILAMALIVPLPLPIKGLVGSLLFVALPEFLRFVGLPPAAAAQLRQTLFGCVLLFVVAQGALRPLPSPQAGARSV
jgi:branched-chain amino acid transport system permease protein